MLENSFSGDKAWLYDSYFAANSQVAYFLPFSLLKYSIPLKVNYLWWNEKCKAKKHQRFSKLVSLTHHFNRSRVAKTKGVMTPQCSVLSGYHCNLKGQG